MKKLFTFICLMMFGIIILNAQPPQGINYQAVARNAGGTLITNANISVRISVLDGSPTGTVQYMETHTTSTNAYGLFSIVIGQGTAGSGTFGTISWGSASKYFKVEVDPAGGSSYVNMGTFQVWSVPYALNALNSENDQDNQLLSLVGNNLSISNGNTVTLPAYLSSVTTNATLSGDGTPGVPLGLAQQGATSGQTLKWNGSAWLPANDLDNDGQTLSLSGNDLTISGGNTVTLPSGLSGSGTLNYIPKFTASSTIGNSMMFDNGTSVGIGLTNPVYNSLVHLHSTGSGAYALLRFTSSTTGATSSDGFAVGHNTNSGDALIWNFEPQIIKFGTDGVERMRIAATGEVGIGIQTPSYLFHVRAASTIRHSGYFNNSFACGSLLATVGVPLTGGTCSVIGEYTGTSTNDGIGVFGKSTSGSDGAGFGGFFEGKYIGVVGRGGAGGLAGVYAYANGATNAIYINGNMAGSGTNNYSSDLKLKKNIRPIEGALDQIMKMKPSLYEFRVGEFGNMELPSGFHFGLVAQDLQEIYPSLVIENDFLGEGREGNFKYLGINYQELTPIIIKAIQELNNRFQSQQQEIEYLKKKIEELEKKTN